MDTNDNGNKKIEDIINAPRYIIKATNAEHYEKLAALFKPKNGKTIEILAESEKRYYFSVRGLEPKDFEELKEKGYNVKEEAVFDHDMDALLNYASKHQRKKEESKYFRYAGNQNVEEYWTQEKMESTVEPNMCIDEKESNKQTPPPKEKRYRIEVSEENIEEFEKDLEKAAKDGIVEIVARPKEREKGSDEVSP